MSNIAINVATMADLLASVIEQFAAAGLPTLIRVGEKHLDENDDPTPGRIVFVPDDGTPDMAPIRLSENGIARIDHQCTAYVWGFDEAGELDGLQRFTAVMITIANMIGALWNAGRGRIALKTMTRSKDTKVATYGEEYQIAFSFKWQINAVTTLQPLPGNLKTQPAAQIPEEPTP